MLGGEIMKILMINKFLFPNGGSETYIFKLGAELKRQGHEVEYFGMEHEDNIVGNSVNSYTSNMDFHEGSLLSKLSYPIRTIYSREARKKIRLVLDSFKPDVCHLNNFNYQLTPSIILEIKAWSKKTKHPCKIVYTAHDYQLVCPNHMCRNPKKCVNCEKCLKGNYIHCFLDRCIHKSALKSVVGMTEAFIWHRSKAYAYIDKIICCSEFMKSKLDMQPIFRKKTVAIHNFIDRMDIKDVHKKDYVLYFGRYHKEKGIETLVNACRQLPDIPFIFAGTGEMQNIFEGIHNIKNVGFKHGTELARLVAEARFTVYPSEWYENCPFSVMESISLGTPVLGADIGGIPELIKEQADGTLFKSGNENELRIKILEMWEKYQHIPMETNAAPQETRFYDTSAYAQKLMCDVYLN